MVRKAVPRLEKKTLKLPLLQKQEKKSKKKEEEKYYENKDKLVQLTLFLILLYYKINLESKL